MVAQSLQSTQSQEIQEEEKSHSLKWTSVSIQEVVENDNRLESSVYGIDGRRARQDLEACKWPIAGLGDKFIKNAFYLGRFKRIYVEKTNGIAFLLPSQITEVHPKADKYISPKTDIDIETTKVRKGQVLLTRSGTIGAVSYVSDTLNNQSLSDDVIRIESKEYSGYVYAYLKSIIGRFLIETNNYGAVVSHIEPEHLKNIPIPNPSPILKQKIHNLIEQSFKLRDESNELVDEAQSLLKGALGLPSVEKLQEKSKQIDKKAGLFNYSISLSELDNRLDASYHAPIVKTIEEHLKKTARELTTIGDSRISRAVILPGRFKRIYVEEGNGIVFFSGKNITELDPSDKKYLSFSQHDKKIKNELTIREGMILITCSGTVGKITLVPRHWDGWTMTHDIIRLVPANNEIAGYLSAWLSCEYAQLMISRFIYGAVVGHIEKEHLLKVSVPLLHNVGIQDEINYKILESNNKRADAYKLEQEALTVLDEQVIYAH